MQAETKEKQKRTPRQAESITAGALKLKIEERITLRDLLTDSIESELKDRKIKLDQEKSEFERMTKLVNGTTA